jgi:hypothetical protein
VVEQTTVYLIKDISLDLLYLSFLLVDLFQILFNALLEIVQ